MADDTSVKPARLILRLIFASESESVFIQTQPKCLQTGRSTFSYRRAGLLFFFTYRHLDELPNEIQELFERVLA